jgi:hypothetical protein
MRQESNRGSLSQAQKSKARCQVTLVRFSPVTSQRRSNSERDFAATAGEVLVQVGAEPGRLASRLSDPGDAQAAAEVDHVLDGPEAARADQRAGRFVRSSVNLPNPSLGYG